MPNRISILGTSAPHVPLAVREYQTITPEEFQTLLDREEYAARTEEGGWTILDYDRATFTRAPSGHCLVMSIFPADPRRYLNPAE